MDWLIYVIVMIIDNMSPFLYSDHQLKPSVMSCNGRHSISANVTKMKVDEILYRILANAFNLI